MSIFSSSPKLINSGEFLRINNEVILIVLPSLTNPDYYKYTEAIVKFLHSKKNQVTILFESSRSKRHQNALKVLRRNLEDLEGVRFQDQKIPDSKTEFRASSYFSNIIFAGEIPSLESPFRHLSKSLHSTFCSEIAHSSDPYFPLKKRKRELITAAQQFLHNYDETKRLLSTDKFTSVFFFNGRFPSQAGVKEAAEEAGIPWFSIEHGSVPSKSIHVEQFQTQDRLSIQKFISSWSSQLRHAEVDSIRVAVANWLTMQKKNRKQNLFLNTNFENLGRFENSSQLAAIFTSSLHEEISCPNWSNDNIQTLTLRTIQHATFLKEQGLRPVVRMHPNTGNGSWRDVGILESNLRRMKVDYILPWEQVSSYALAAKSEVVSTWRSTLGLEMLAAGVSINLLSDSQYDLITNCDPLLSSNLPFKYVTDPHSHSDSSQFVLYYYFNHGISLEQLSVDFSNSSKESDYHKALLPHFVLRGIRRRLSVLSPLILGYYASPNNWNKILCFLLGDALGFKTMNQALKLYANQLQKSE